MVLVGTGTDVGKTYVARQLARLYRARGGACLALKPIESGVDPAQRVAGRLSGDAAALADAANAGAAPLYGLREPISPHLAARREQRAIDLEAVAAYVAAQEQNFLSQLEATASDAGATGSGAGLPPLCLIESAGGLFSPISDELNNWDLARALAPDVIVLVAPDSLGVLHDIQATLRGIAPVLPQLLVMSEARPADAATGTNLAEVERVVLRQLGLIGQLPCVLCSQGGAPPEHVFQLLGLD